MLAISANLCLHGDEYIVYVSPSCLRAVSGYLSSKHNNNRYLLLSLSLPPTTLQAFALCLAWQQCEVNRMNKTYLNQSPLPWEMSSCQYSLMGKHRAGPKGQTVYCAAPTKMQPGQLVSLYITNTQTLAHLTQTHPNAIIRLVWERHNIYGSFQRFAFHWGFPVWKLVCTKAFINYSEERNSL